MDTSETPTSDPTSSAFYGLYRSSVSCVETFVSTPADSPAYPPQVSASCRLCARTHAFRLDKVQTASTPSQARAYRAYALARGWQVDIAVP